MEFYELIIDRTKFNSGWEKRDRCGWCEAPLRQSQEQYLSRGNICGTCSAKINDIHMKKIEQEKAKRLQDKKRMLETLGSQLEHDLDEAQRLEIVADMEKLHREIKYAEILREI